jgi:predicted DNA-binding transcriptional regulator AlpA
MARRTDSERQAAALLIAKQFDSLPDDAYVRVRIVSALLGCSNSTTWRAEKAGRIPPSRHITPGIAGWHVGTLRRKLRERPPEA